MFARSARIVVVATLAGLATAAQAQEIPVLPLPPLPDTVTAPPAALAAEDVWQGAWQGEWVPDGTYHGTWAGTYRAPSGVADTGYAAPGRLAWLEQCRRVYYPASAPAVQPDACASHLAAYEHAYAIAASGTVPYGAYALGGFAPGALTPAPRGYGYPAAPVIWVRVPIVRERVAAGQ